MTDGKKVLTPEEIALLPPLKPGDVIPPERNGGMEGFVVGNCGHRVAASEWRAGFRNCEHCPVGDPDEEDEYPSPADISYDADSPWVLDHGHTGLLVRRPGVSGCGICERLVASDPRFAEVLGSLHNPDGSRKETPHGR